MKNIDKERFIELVDEMFEQKKYSNNGSTKGITQATYFRFLLPNLLPTMDII